MQKQTNHTPILYNKPLPGIAGKLLLNEPMAFHTSFKIGGPADLFAIPADPSDVQVLLRWAYTESLPVFVLGAGSNLLVSDRGIRGVVVQLGAGFKNIHIHDTKAIAGSAVSLPALIRRALGAGLAGLEGLAGIPGTVGGAVCMNAGTPVGCVGDSLKSVKALTRDGEQIELGAGDLGLEYRRSAVQEHGLLITEAVFDLRHEDTDSISKIVASLISKRKVSQPVGIGTAGSVFKNPEGDFAGRILDTAGAKGMQVGGARVSSKHANFIENTGDATAADVRELILRLQQLAKEKFAIDLELEVQLVGECNSL